MNMAINWDEQKEWKGNGATHFLRILQELAMRGIYLLVISACFVLVKNPEIFQLKMLFRHRGDVGHRYFVKPVLHIAGVCFLLKV